MEIVPQLLRKEIPLMAWSPDLIKIFEDMKKCIKSSPILARFDPTKPVFLKTDWSAEVMTWTLMQPADDKESNKAANNLVPAGECDFDLEKNVARLQPVSYGFHLCKNMETIFHYVVG